MTVMSSISITENAANRIRELIAAEGSSGTSLRVIVSAGGCSGFSYSFELDDNQSDQDKIFESHGVQVIIDEISLEILGGSEIDFVEDLMGAAFKLKIPNATSSCGCGVSFAV